MCFRTGVQLPSSPPYRQKEQAPFRFRFTAKTALCLLLLPCLILNGVFLIPDYLFLFRVEYVHDLIEAGCFPVKLRLLCKRLGYHLLRICNRNTSFSHCRFNLLGDTNSMAQPAQIERCNKEIAGSLMYGHTSPRRLWSSSCSPYCSLGKSRKKAQLDAGMPTKT